MAGGNRLQINVLGTSFTIRADEDEAYMKRILWYLERKSKKPRNALPSPIR
jgi:hypothetical protein